MAKTIDFSSATTNNQQKNELTPMELYFQTALSQIQNMGGGGSAGSPQNYMGQAQGMLGGLDTSAFEQLRQALLGSSATAKEGLKTQFDNLLESLLVQGKENKQQLGQSRGTIMEDAFSRNRDAYRNLAARGLGGSGLQQLAGVQNRMETGRQVSGVTGQYYDNAAKLAEAEEQGNEAYAQQNQVIDDTTNQNLASLSAQEIQYKNSYQQQLANLAMQLQANAQSQMNASSSAEMAKIQALLGLQAQQAQYLETTGAEGTETTKLQIAGSDDSIEIKIANWMDKFDSTRSEAIKGINAYKGKYESGKEGEYFSAVQQAVDRVNSKGAVANVFTNLKDTYLSGATNLDSVVDFVAKNLNNLNKGEYIGYVESLSANTARDMGGDRLAALYLLMNKGVISVQQYNSLKKQYSAK